MERAVAAGDPPVSAKHPADEEWLAAQQNWLASWDAPALPDGPGRRRQWDKRKEHARLVAAAAAASQMPAPKRARPPAPSGRHRVHAGPPKLRKPPPPTNADQEAREAYELQMGMYGIARDARRKLPRRTKAEDAKRKKRERKETHQGIIFWFHGFFLSVLDHVIGSKVHGQAKGTGSGPSRKMCSNR